MRLAGEPYLRNAVRRRGVLAVLTTAWVAAVAQAAEPVRTYPPGRFEQGELRYVGDVPLLVVAGSPAEMGRQQAALTGNAARSLAALPTVLAKLMGIEESLPELVRRGRQLLPQFPPDHRTEFDAFVQQTGVREDLALTANTFTDVYRGGCSSLIVAGDRSTTGGPLFGRNLDFPAIGALDRFILVVVHRPKQKRAFATVGYPMMFGCLSGMNDAGLAAAVHNVYQSADGAAIFDPKGVPYTLAFRRILEECETVAEAEKLLRTMPRTTMLNLAVCDRKTAGVLEMTPKSVAFRGLEGGLCACTNHFRTPGLAAATRCRRYAMLSGPARDRLAIEDVAARLHAANQGALTVQTMIFEPKTLVLHLATGIPPTSARPLSKLELAEPLGVKPAAK